MGEKGGKHLLPAFYGYSLALLLYCHDRKHMIRNIELIPLDEDSPAEFLIYFNITKSNLHKELLVPLRSIQSRDCQHVIDVMALVLESVADLTMRQILRILQIVCSLGILRVEVHENAPLLQKAIPLLIRFHRMRQSPGQVTGNQDIEALIRKIRLLRITNLRRHIVRIQLIGFDHLIGLNDHLLGQIHAVNAMARATQKNFEETCATSQIQDSQTFPLILINRNILIRKNTRLFQSFADLASPSIRLAALDLIMSEFEEAICTLGPVFFYQLFNILAFILERKEVKFAHFVSFQLMTSSLSP